MLVVAVVRSSSLCCFFFFTAPPPSEIYTLSLHDALPILSDISATLRGALAAFGGHLLEALLPVLAAADGKKRSEEHTSELQSRFDLVCRLLLEKKKTQPIPTRSMPSTRSTPHPRVPMRRT